MSEKLYLDVVIPVFNGQATLKLCIESLRESSGIIPNIIVVDDASTDNSLQIAQKLADKVIALPYRKGPAQARRAGMENATGDIVVFVDSDISVRPDTLWKIWDCFEREPEISAVTGMLAEANHSRTLMGRYKNLYMHYIFKDMQPGVDFLYGSIFALKRGLLPLLVGHDIYPEDTLWGRILASHGHAIRFCPEIQAIHHKEFNILTLLINDFRVSRGFGKIFVKTQRLKRLSNRGYIFAHASTRQIFSLCMAVLAVLIGHLIASNICISLILGCWLMLQKPFFSYLFKRLGLFSTFMMIIFTFLDHLIMSLGALCGIISAIFPKRQEFGKAYNGIK